MSSYGVVHLVSSFFAIAAGGVVLLLPKGTRWHRTLGHAYVMGIVGVVATSFALYDLTGGFGPFHFAALVAGLTLFGGLYTVLWRRPRKKWIDAHAIWMSWSYIGLMAAFVAETATRFVMPRVEPYLEGRELWGVFWTSVAVASVGVMVLGLWLVRTRLPGAIERTPQAIRRERRELEALETGARAEA